MSQRELADVIGSTQALVSFIESGNIEPGAGKLVSIFMKWPKEGVLFVKMIKETKDAEKDINKY